MRQQKRKKSAGRDSRPFVEELFNRSSARALPFFERPDEGTNPSSAAFKRPWAASGNALPPDPKFNRHIVFSDQIERCS